MRTLAQAVRACAPNAAGRTMTAGFDGFVDTLVRPVCRVGTDGQADVCALVNWSELPFAQALWQAVFEHAFADAPADKGRYAFFDLCDCARRAPEEIAAVLRLIGRCARPARVTILTARSASRPSSA